jgi:molybdenum cofactor cytidylyltransferase
MGRRYGAGNKLLAERDGKPLIARAIENVLDCPSLSPVYLVLGHQYERILAAVRRIPDSRARILLNENYREGRAASLRLAVESLPEGAPGLAVFLGDMPNVPAALAEKVLEAFRETGRASFPWVGGRKGHPVVLPASLFAGTLSLRGDEGFRLWIEAHPEECVRVPWDDPRVLEDVDFFPG